MSDIWAHSDSEGYPPSHPHAGWQRLAEHLAEVAVLAGQLAKAAAPHKVAFCHMAKLAGILHDYGKYQECFQRMLKGQGSGCPHAIYGALALRLLPKGAGDRAWALPVAQAIAAHHAGLKDRAVFTSDTDPANDFPKERSDRKTTEAIEEVAYKDQELIRRALKETPATPPTQKLDLFTRMLLSCLVDADRLNTAGLNTVQAPLQPERRLEQLLDHLAHVRQHACKNGSSPEVLRVREEVQELCAATAASERRLFSLTVPTGGGKTLAAMRFALERARARPGEVRRIIVVIPYLSIIEQNARVYRNVFGAAALLEHHSNAVQRLMIKTGEEGPFLAPRAEEQQGRTFQRPALETENWDAPLIVTTNVRFFESIFSNHPSDLRRLHNIAGSVVILDEVQTLPRRLLTPLLEMLRELTDDWGCTVVCSTATQPAFEQRKGHAPAYLWPQGSVEPIVPPEKAAEMHKTLRRVTIDWRLKRRTTWEELTDHLSTESQVLCVLNTRDHVAKVYALLCNKVPATERSGVFHLSTRMCAQHRLAVLRLIRYRLRKGLPCRIVSSQLIEAGVDLSVPVAYRALGPLDAVVQVAGRVDREGVLTEAAGSSAGRLIVFLPEDDAMPPHEYRHAAGITEALGKELGPQTDDLAAMRRFFESYYSGADELARGGELARMRRDEYLEFATLAEQFEYINARTENVFVPHGRGASLLKRVREQRFVDFALLRSLQRYTVGLQPWELERMRRSLEEIPLRNGTVLLACMEAQYEGKGRGLLPEIPADQFIV